MDSMFNPLYGTNALKMVQTYLFLETVRLQGEKEARYFKIRLVPDVPQQTNGYDCGVFLCQYAESISLGCTRASPRTTCRLSAATWCGRS